MKLSSKIAFSALALSFSSLASAQVYVGGNLGQSNTTFNTSDFSSAGASTSFDKTQTAYKGFAGYNFNKYFAVEGGYADLGKPTAKNSWLGWSEKSVQEESAWFAAAKGTLPINEQFNLFGKLGMTYNKVTTTFSNPSGASSASKTSSGLLFGLGAEYNVTKQIGIRLEYEDFGKFGNQQVTGRTNTTMWSLGAAYKF